MGAQTSINVTLEEFSSGLGRGSGDWLWYTKEKGPDGRHIVGKGRRPGQHLQVPEIGNMLKGKVAGLTIRAEQCSAGWRTWISRCGGRVRSKPAMTACICCRWISNI